jgi:GT2 family glycosyltransferase
MLTSIIIPSYNGAELLQMCLEAIRRHTPEPHEIIVVDDGSRDHTVNLCVEYRCRFIRFPRNRGFPVACNAGLRLATGNLLLLLNNDVIVADRWLGNLQACLLSDPSIGIVGPCTNYASGQQRVKELPYETLDQYMRMSDTLNQPDASRWREVSRLIGFCMLMRRDLPGKVGLLDERYAPGHYEDDDYCHRVRMAGYKLMLAGDTFVHHMGSASFRKQPARQLKRILQRNRRLFISKWGYDPRMMIHE